MSDDTKPIDFDAKVLEARRFIAKLSPSSCEQNAIAMAACHHFELKQRIAAMHGNEPKADMSMAEKFRIADGESISRTFEVRIHEDKSQVKAKVSPVPSEWKAENIKDKILVKYGRPKKRRRGRPRKNKTED